MRSIRRVVLLVLLLAVPFQAAIGATGALCSPNSHHSHDAVVETHADGSPASGGHHHHSKSAPAHHDAAGEPGSHGASDKCKICSECCFTAAPVPAAINIAVPPDTLLRVSSIVDQAVVSRAGDGLFRPPRTTSV